MAEEAVVTSLEQRIAAKYGLSPEPAPELPPAPEGDQPEPEEGTESTVEDAETREPALEEVEYNGKVYQVPKELKDGLMSKADYTRKTQDLANNRRNLELHQQQVKEFLEQQTFERTLSTEITQAQMLDLQLSQYRNLDWSNMQDGEILRRRMEMDQLRDRKAELENSLRTKRQQFSQEQKRRLQETLAKAQESLTKNIPGWGEKLATEVSEYALSRGYSSVEVNNVWNPRDVETLFKAMSWDKLASSEKEALNKARKAPPIVKPGSVKPMPQEKREELNYRKAMTKAKADGASSSETARLIKQRLEQKFR